METYINRLKASFIFQIVVGIILAIIMVYYTVSAGIDNATATGPSIAIGALLGAAMALMPLVIVPIMSIRELNEYSEKGSLFITHVASFVVIAFIFFPLAFWQIFLLKKIKTLNKDLVKS